jgi:SAM-dependent methyltransferase
MPAKANAEWQKWGEVDPLWGVASWAGKSRADNEPWREDEFYEMGESDWHDFQSQWTQYGVSPGHCVEIGCGAARLTRPMARFFEHVHGVDIAEGMLKRARPVVEGLPVTLHLSDGVRLPLEDRSVDAAFSTHVFQHLDSIDDVLGYWREIARVLRPGGTLMVHLPVHLWPGGLEPMEHVYNARRFAGDIRANLKRRSMARAGGPPIMRGRSYSWSWIDTTLQGLGFRDIELRVFRVSVNGGVHPFVLARRT